MNDDLTNGLIAELEGIADLITCSMNDLSKLVRSRDEVIRDLKNLKVPNKVICSITGLTRQRIQQIKRQ